MSKSRLYIVSELFYPEQTSTGYFVTEIAASLALNREVVAVCARPTYSEKHVKTARTEIYKGIRIHRLVSSAFNKDRMLGRLLNLLTFTFLSVFTVVRYVRRGDTALVLTNPPTVPPLVGLWCKLVGARAILLVHDVYPEVLIATEHLTTSSLVFRLLKIILDRPLRLFDTIVVLGRDMEKLLSEKLGTDRRRLTIIPNWGDTNEIRPIDRATNSFAQQLGVQGKCVIQFSGNLGRTHDLDAVVRAAELTLDIPNLVFLVIGDGGGLRRLLVDRGQSVPGNVMLLPRQPREKLPEMLACADATLIPFLSGMLGVSVPSRMYNIMAAGVPIIALADASSELAQCVSEEDAGWVLPIGDSDKLAALVRRIATDATEARLKGHNGRAAAERVYNFASAAAAFDRLL